jgi:hypothetical protein
LSEAVEKELLAKFEVAVLQMIEEPGKALFQQNAQVGYLISYLTSTIQSNWLIILCV